MSSCLGFVTLIRVVVLIALAALRLGADRRVDRIAPARSRIACSRSSNSSPPFRPICSFPSSCSRSSRFHLNPEIWLSPLMILGTQWYILFNVIAGTLALPTDYQYVAGNLGVTRWLWWRRLILPASFPPSSPARSRPRAARGTPASSPRS